MNLINFRDRIFIILLFKINLEMNETNEKKFFDWEVPFSEIVNPY